MGLQYKFSIFPGANADDVDVAFKLVWTGIQSGTVTYNLTSATSLVLNDPTNATTTLLFASYTNLGLLEDAVDAVPGWHFIRHGGTRAMSTGSSNLLTSGGAVTAQATPQGVKIFWDTSVILARRFPIGPQCIEKYQNGALVPALAQAPYGNSLSIIFDPTRPIAVGFPTLNSASPKLASALYTINAIAGTTGAVWHFTKCYKTHDAETYTRPGEATGVRSELGPSSLGNDGIESGPEGWIVGEYIGTAAFTANSYGATGAIGRYKSAA